MDLPEVRELWPLVQEELVARGVEAPMAVSAITGDGVQTLLRQALALLDELPEQPVVLTEPPVYRPEIDEDYFEIQEVRPQPEDEGARWRVSGVRIERAAVMTNWDYYESQLRFQRILEAMGISQALEQAGVEDGDVVMIGDVELVWGDQA
jgi:GTP-binding protein